MPVTLLKGKGREKRPKEVWVLICFVRRKTPKIGTGYEKQEAGKSTG